MGLWRSLFCVGCGLVVGAAVCAADHQARGPVLGGISALGLQCQALSRASHAVDACRLGAALQPEVLYHPVPDGTLALKLGLAAGNALAPVSPFVLAPWAADLQDDVARVSGTDRAYLLTAWYRHRFALADDTRLAATLGVIDATDYLDGNAYANDEYTQFMNEALVNGPNAYLPSYEPGGALRLDMGRWSLRGVAMRVPGEEDGHFLFVAGQIGYRLRSALGSGTYRLLLKTTERDFLSPTNADSGRLGALLLSFDQQLGTDWGAFVRASWQSDTATDGYHAVYTGGLDRCGRAWGREGDNIGLGLGYLVASGTGLASTRVAELYYRWAATDRLGLTADLQYLDQSRTGTDEPEGLVFGLRLTYAL